MVTHTNFKAMSTRFNYDVEIKRLRTMVGSLANKVDALQSTVEQLDARVNDGELTRMDEMDIPLPDDPLAEVELPEDQTPQRLTKEEAFAMGEDIGKTPMHVGFGRYLFV